MADDATGNQVLPLLELHENIPNQQDAVLHALTSTVFTIPAPPPPDGEPRRPMDDAIGKAMAVLGQSPASYTNIAKAQARPATNHFALSASQKQVSDFKTGTDSLGQLLKGTVGCMGCGKKPGCHRLGCQALPKNRTHQSQSHVVGDVRKESGDKIDKHKPGKGCLTPSKVGDSDPNVVHPTAETPLQATTAARKKLQPLPLPPNWKRDAMPQDSLALEDSVGSEEQATIDAIPEPCPADTTVSSPGRDSGHILTHSGAPADCYANQTKSLDLAQEDSLLCGGLLERAATHAIQVRCNSLWPLAKCKAKLMTASEQQRSPADGKYAWMGEKGVPYLELSFHIESDAAQDSLQTGSFCISDPHGDGEESAIIGFVLTQKLADLASSCDQPLKTSIETLLDTLKRAYIFNSAARW